MVAAPDGSFPPLAAPFNDRTRAASALAAARFDRRGALDFRNQRRSNHRGVSQTSQYRHLARKRDAEANSDGREFG